MRRHAGASEPQAFYDDEKAPPSSDPKVRAAAKKGWLEGTAEYEAQQKKAKGKKNA